MKLLGKKIVEKPWGKDVLPPQFQAPAGKRIGEVWFEPPPELPDILVKYIFTSEKLSVQVHPSDDQARELGESDRGKEECWLVIDAEPGATLGIGFKEPVDADTMRRAALDGTIENLMQWFPVKPGDFFYIPAGTVHAIGAGVSLIEIQQNSDITYRLYDYGRPRELHLDKGLAVAKGMRHDPTLRKEAIMDRSLRLADGPNFLVDLTVAAHCSGVASIVASSSLIVPITGDIIVSDSIMQPGECGFFARDTELNISKSMCYLVVQRV